MKLRPLHDRIIVKRLEEERKSAGGIVIPDTAAEKPSMGEVVAAGPGKTDDNVIALDIVTYDGTRLTVGPTSPEELARTIAEGGRHGEIYSRLKTLSEKYAPAIRAKYPDIPRRVSGYNLPFLLPENGFDVARALGGSLTCNGARTRLAIPLTAPRTKATS